MDDLDNEINRIQRQSKVDINLIEEILSFTRNIYQTYVDAPDFLKRHYLRFFFEKIYVKNNEIAKVVYTPIFSVLVENNGVILNESLLEKWNRFGINLRI